MPYIEKEYKAESVVVDVSRQNGHDINAIRSRTREKNHIKINVITGSENDKKEIKKEIQMAIRKMNRHLENKISYEIYFERSM